MSVRKTEMLVELPSNRADWAIAHNRERGADVHARCKTVGRLAFLVHTLIEQTHADNFVLLDERLRDRCARPDLDGTGALHLRPDPLHELAHRKNHAAVFVEEGRSPWQIQRVLLERQREFERVKEKIAQTEHCRTPARTMRVEQIKHLFLADGRRHGNAGLVDFRKSCPQRPRFCHDARNAEPDVIRAFITQHLRRHSGHGGALDSRCAVGIGQLFR